MLFPNRRGARRHLFAVIARAGGRSRNRRRLRLLDAPLERGMTSQKLMPTALLQIGSIPVTSRQAIGRTGPNFTAE
jgi:hypothetical protein